MGRLIDRIVLEWEPLQVWLFGSRARGDARPHSDWDLLVVLPDGAPETARLLADPLAAWRVVKETGVCADVILCTLSEYEEDRSTPNTIPFEVAGEGVLLHER